MDRYTWEDFDQFGEEYWDGPITPGQDATFEEDRRPPPDWARGGDIPKFELQFQGVSEM